jgi:hypothetical protein
VGCVKAIKGALERKLNRWDALHQDPTCLKMVSKQREENNIQPLTK